MTNTITATTSQTANTLRAFSAARHARRAVGPAGQLYEAVGREVLDEATAYLLRNAVEAPARVALGKSAPLLANPIVEQAAGWTARKTLQEATRAAGQDVTRTALKQVGGTLARGAGAGALLDGGIAGVESIVRYRRGEMTGQEALAHTATEAGTGAAASAAGVGAVAALVFFTGPVGWGATLAVGGSAALGAKFGLRRLVG